VFIIISIVLAIIICYYVRKKKICIPKSKRKEAQKTDQPDVEVDLPDLTMRHPEGPNADMPGYDFKRLQNYQM
jgi:hypothetical protein